MSASAINALLGAQTKDSVAWLLNTCFRNRHDSSLVSLETVKGSFSLEDDEAAKKVVAATTTIITRIVYHSSDIDSAEAVAACLPSKVDARLGALLGKIIFAKLSTWRAAAAAGSIAPPKLVGSDWRVDVKASTAGVKRTGEPTLLLNLKVQANASAVGEMPPTDTVTAELSQGALATLLGGLHQVRDQLAAAAQ